MAALVLAEVGFRDINFGANTPLALLADQAVEWGARLVWISVSAAPDSRTLRTQIEGFVPTLARRKIDLAIGGLHSADVIPRGVPNVHAIGSMAELAGFARGLLSRKAATKPPA